jgi:hypothetical protein
MSPCNDLDTPTAQRGYKAYATLAAQLAMLGYSLIKTDPAVGAGKVIAQPRRGA